MPDREYPDFYEKIIPIAIKILLFILIGILIFIIAVGTGWLNFN